ncbi:hypothetical protein GW17_00044759 [Ensete ventricosum]|nr:hypothetical protein GW17_00044759 [Ensete ventricosum]
MKRWCPGLLASLSRSLRRSIPCVVRARRTGNFSQSLTHIGSWSAVISRLIGLCEVGMSVSCPIKDKAKREIWAYPSSGRPQGVDTLVLFPATPGTHGDWLVRPRLGPRLLLLCGDGRALLKAAAAAVVLSLP